MLASLGRLNNPCSPLRLTGHPWNANSDAAVGKRQGRQAAALLQWIQLALHGSGSDVFAASTGRQSVYCATAWCGTEQTGPLLSIFHMVFACFRARYFVLIACAAPLRDTALPDAFRPLKRNLLGMFVALHRGW